MPEVAYLFERFPSFGQTFCYREVAELERQGTKVHVYSIRRPTDEPKQDWDEQIVRRVHYLPDEERSCARSRSGAAGRKGVAGDAGDGGEMGKAIGFPSPLSGHLCRAAPATTRASAMFMRTLPEWRRGPPFGSSSSSEFRTALPRTRTTSLRRAISWFRSRN